MMAKLSTAQRKQIPKSDFAVPSKAPASGSYPINDKAHAQNALARASGKPVEGQVKAAVAKKFPGMASAKKSAANIKAKLSARSKNKTSVGF